MHQHQKEALDSAVEGDAILLETPRSACETEDMVSRRASKTLLAVVNIHRPSPGKLPTEVMACYVVKSFDVYYGLWKNPAGFVYSG